MTAHLPKAWAPLWGALLAPLFYPTAGICPGTGSSGENESAVRLLVVVVVMGGVCVYVCVHALRWEGGSVGESQPASFFQDMGKKGGGIAPLIPAQRGQDPVRQGGAATQTSLLGTVPAPGGRMGREQVLCFSRQAVSMKPSPRGPGAAPRLLTPTHTHAHAPAHAHSLQLLLRRVATRFPGPQGPAGAHICAKRGSN